MKAFLILGAVNALLSVALGAFGAHGLEGKISERLMDVYKTGVQYHMMHALGLIFIAFLAERFGGTSMIQWAGWVMLIGIILFSGSLYALSVTNIGMLGMITPFGGVAFITSWALVAIAAFKTL